MKRTRNQTLFISLLLLLIFRIPANGQDGWFDPGTIATPVTGTSSEWFVAALGTEASFDNVRLNAMIVYDLYSNTSFGTYLGGSSDADAGVYVISYNHTTQQQYGPRPIYIFSDVGGTSFDGHSYPTIVKTLDGHIHVFVCDQRGDHNNVHIRFDERGTIQSNFTPEVLMNGGDGIYGRPGSSPIRGEYPKPFVSRNGDLYFFSRYIPYGEDELSFNYGGESYRVALRPQVYVKSKDNGLTWEPVQQGIYRDNEEDFLTEPYLTQVVPEMNRDGVEERIHFTFTLAAGIGLWYEGSNLRYNYHNAYANNIYHAYFVPGEDAFYSIDGKNLGRSIKNEEIDKYCLVKKTFPRPYPLPMTEAQYDEITQNRTSIMGNYTTITEDGEITVNGSYTWNGTNWNEFSNDLRGDTRLIDRRRNQYFAYDGLNTYVSDKINGPWDQFGRFDMTGTAVANRDINVVKSCPPARLSHPEAFVWVKAYAPSSNDYGGYAFLGGHRTSYVPNKLVVEVEKGSVLAGGSVNVNAFVVDENGARVLSADNSINFSSSIGSFSNNTVAAYQGLSKSVLTVNDNVLPGEYVVNVTSNGLDAGIAYVTVIVDDSEIPSVPTNLSAEVKSSSQVDLSWNASSDNIGIAYYQIFRNGEDLVNTKNTNYSDLYLDHSTEYTYTVVAVDYGYNQSNVSNSVTVVTPTLSDHIHTYPNPRSESSTILYSVENSGSVKLELYNLFGKLVDVVDEDFKEAGSYEFTYDATLPSGFYILVLRTSNSVNTFRLVQL